MCTCVHVYEREKGEGIGSREMLMLEELGTG